jgi:hypothetical protein
MGWAVLLNSLADVSLHRWTQGLTGGLGHSQVDLGTHSLQSAQRVSAALSVNHSGSTSSSAVCRRWAGGVFWLFPVPRLVSTRNWSQCSTWVTHSIQPWPQGQQPIPCWSSWVKAIIIYDLNNCPPPSAHIVSLSSLTTHVPERSLVWGAIL